MNGWGHDHLRWYVEVAMRAGLIGLVLFALAAPAQAGTVLVHDGQEDPQPYQRWVDEMRMPTPDVRIRLVLGMNECRGNDACINGERIALDRHASRYSLGHELGHLFIGEYMTTPVVRDGVIVGSVLNDADERTARTLLSWGPWRRWGWRAEWWDVEEALADAYYACSVNGRRLAVNTRLYDDYGSRYQHRKLCRFLRAAAR